MKCVFEASNNLDAHMISDLINQQGIKSQIQGEHLQGGIGDLQAIGFVRVVVDEADYINAKEIVKRWDENQTDETPIVTHKNTSNIATGIFLGLAIGIAATYWVYNSPVTTNGIDHNKDGVPDEIMTYKNNRINRVEMDRNFDSETDFFFYMTLKDEFINPNLMMILIESLKEHPHIKEVILFYMKQI